MRVFYDPATLALVSTGISAFSTVQGGFAAKAEAEGEAEFLKLQAGQEEREARREARDEREQGEQRLSRMRAQLAGQGVDLASGTAIGLTSKEIGETAIRLQRGAADSEARRTTLLAKAKNTKAQGKQALTSGLLGGASQGFGGASTFLGSS